MNKYKIVYKNGKSIIVTANNSLEVIRKYDLASKNNISTKLIQLWIYQS